MIILDREKYLVNLDDGNKLKPIELTRTEWDLLVYLYDHKDRVCSKEEILSHVWPEGRVPKINTVEVYVKYLRGKLGNNEIITRRGFGYQLNTENN